jgi:hypothetical protein
MPPRAWRFNAARFPSGFPSALRPACSGRRFEEFQHEAVEFIRMLEEGVMPGLVKHDPAGALDRSVQLVGRGKRRKFELEILKNGPLSFTRQPISSRMPCRIFRAR